MAANRMMSTTGHCQKCTVSEQESGFNCNRIDTGAERNGLVCGYTYTRIDLCVRAV